MPPDQSRALPDHPTLATALTADRFGPADQVIRAVTAPLPAPGPGQVALSLIAASINPSDLISLSGAYAARLSLPMVGGYESVARVIACGPGVTGLAPGDRVWPLGGPGAWASARLADADWCIRVDPRLGDDQAATAYVNPLTAWLMLDDAQITPQTRLVVSAAGSVIGRMILRLATRRGLRPVAVLRSPASVGRLAELDLAGIITDPDPGPALSRVWGGAGADLALDCVGGATGHALMAALRPGGRLVHYGLLSGQPIGTSQPLRRDVTFQLFVLRNWVHARPRAELAAAMADLVPLILDGTLATKVAGRMPLGQFGDALARLAEPGRDGKWLLIPDAPCR
ncbi:zinc-dependent alcohol dehydrogenase family protein [Paracoccus sp. p4-l81]|uniref:zinc-dependent alcohol dehydrogenase family protein n=1 Tax=Paracoccus sp. p4-l81 TaxID=3342806 RepID=UPI0035B7A2DB